MSATDIDAALAAPIGAEPIERLASGALRVAIAIDDITRPTPTALVLPHLLRRLDAAGVPRRHITVVIASGAHRRATEEDLNIKTGVDRGDLTVVPHDPAGDMVDTGLRLGGVAVRVNRVFMEADLRVGICGVIPHPFAAFSGGGKIVLPGLANLEVLARTHKFALMGLRGGHALDGNRFRSEMEDVVRRIGLQWAVNVVINSRCAPVGLKAGDMVESHRAAAALAAVVGATPPPAHPLDVLLMNAYPKDGELLQVEAAFVALRSGMLRWLEPGAPIVLMAACPYGLGHHGLFGPGGSLFRLPAAKTFLSDHPLLVYAPGVLSDVYSNVFWAGYPHFTAWPDVISNLRARVPVEARVGVVPCAPLQLAMESPHAA